MQTKGVPSCLVFVVYGVKETSEIFRLGIVTVTEMQEERYIRLVVGYVREIHKGVSTTYSNIVRSNPKNVNRRKICSVNVSKSEPQMFLVLDTLSAVQRCAPPLFEVLETQNMRLFLTLFLFNVV